MRRFCLFLLCCLLSAIQALGGSVLINEFLADNSGGLRDEDGDDSGWIELYNGGAGAVNLAGWHLTDDALVPAKWTFPAVNLTAGGYLVIFTSGKNRASAGQTLHTNFKLDPDGEYLALIAPDNAPASIYSPAYPKQRRNVSFASVGDTRSVNLLGSNAVIRYLVPLNDALGMAWTEPGFDDSAWTNGTAGLGYDTVGGSGAPLLSVDINDRETTTAALTATGFQAFVINGTTTPQSGPVARTFGAISLAITDTGGVTYDDRRRTTPVNSGALTDELLLQDFIFARDTAGNQGLDITASGLPANLPVSVRVWSFDSGSPSSRVSDWSCNGLVVKENYTFNGSTLPTTNEQYRFDFNAITSGSGQLLISGRRDTASAANLGVFLNALQITPISFAPAIGTSVEAAMRNVNASIYARMPFSIADPATIQTVRFRVKYDDGFAAYINGQLLISRNGPVTPAWNSTATADRSRTDALVFEEISVQVPAGLLKTDNVLAIQGFNLSTGDTDFLLRIELDGLGALPPSPRYFNLPTPGKANAQGYDGFVADTGFSVYRGFFTAPFSVAIHCETPGAQIRYTTDGNTPGATTGTPYSGPIAINTLTIVRAAAFLPNWIPSNTDTQSYIFKSAVAQQPANPPGWPATWGTDSEVNTNDGAGTGIVASDYEMDPAVVNNTVAGYGVNDALGAIPTLSVALPPADFLGPNGIYQNPNSSDLANAAAPLWERASSFEFLNSDGSEEFHLEGGLQIHGGSSRRPYRLQKHSFGLKFKARYGAGRLHDKLFADDSIKSFNSLVLRGCFTDAWALVSWDPARYRPDDSVYFRDIWTKRAFREMGWLQSTSRPAHLYINGLYWGVYDLAEELDEDFFADHLGGLAADWDIIADFSEVKAGTAAGFNGLFTTANAGLSTPAAYATLRQSLDVVNFADYYLLHIHFDAEDWPHHNWYAARNRVDPAGKFRFYVWDQEIALDNHNLRRIEPADTNSNIDKTPGRLFQQLRQNPEWRLLFADRAHKHLHNNGALSLASCQVRWDQLKSTYDKAIVAESARWGDVASKTPYAMAPSKPRYTREADWLPTIAAVRNNYLPALYNNANSFATIAELRAAGLYPVTEPPAFSLHGGTVQPGYNLSISAPAGSIYYTLNGSDPREAITGNPAGTAYAGSIVLNQSGTVKARVRNGTEWSALTEAAFVTGVAAASQNLAVSKIFYNPPSPDDLEEFIELINLSRTDTVALTGAHFTAGITFNFPDGFSLGPGERTVVVRDIAAFTTQFGTALPVAGQFSGALDNNGEEIALADSTNTDIFRFSYKDSIPWPEEADGGGRSLIAINPRVDSNPALAENWRASISPTGGIPGKSDSFTFAGTASEDLDKDGFNAALEYLFGTSDTVPSLAPTPVQSIQGLIVNGAFDRFLTLSFQHRPGADDVVASVQYNTDPAGTWEPAVFVSRTPGGFETWRAPVPVNGARQFLRLQVRLP
ncbi:MAG: CotH protein [Chthoniobacteraceae bacterium]|nr:CotH protein [Chthoniobacteraceae bacterium]